MKCEIAYCQRFRGRNNRQPVIEIHLLIHFQWGMHCCSFHRAPLRYTLILSTMLEEYSKTRRERRIYGQKRKFVKCNKAKTKSIRLLLLEKGILCFLKRKRSKNSILFLISRWNNFKVYIFGNKSKISKVNLLRKQGYCVGSNFFCFPKRKEGITIQ